MGFGGVSPHAAAETLKQVRRITRRGVTINTFMLDDAPELVVFVEPMTRINKGRALYTQPARARLLRDGRLPVAPSDAAALMGVIPGVARRAGAQRGPRDAPAWRRARCSAARAPFWLLARLAPPFEETRTARLPFARERSSSLLETLRALDAAARDPHVDGVLLRCAGAPHGYAAAASLRRALDAVRAAGKPVVAYGETLQPGRVLGRERRRAAVAARDGIDPPRRPAQRGVLPARACSTRLDVQARRRARRLAQDRGRDLHARVDVAREPRADRGAISTTCSASWSTRSPPGARLDAATVRERIDAGPYRARRRCEAGLADGCLYPDQVEEALVDLLPETRRGAAVAAGAPRARLVDADAYAALHADDPGWSPLLRASIRASRTSPRAA